MTDEKLLPDEIFVEPDENAFGDYGLRFTPNRDQARYIRADLTETPERDEIIRVLREACEEAYYHNETPVSVSKKCCVALETADKLGGRE